MTIPSWKDLDDETEKKELPTDHIKNVLARIGQTPDGEIFRKFIEETMVYAPWDTGLSDSALREKAAERRVAIRFLRLLERPLAQTERRRSKSKPVK